jgi:MerR family transcriptional regulator, redox-sensitive transcriptional activator SoxR
MLRPDDVLPIGDLARRTGLSVSAIRFYEAKGLIAPRRSPGGQRRFLRADLRRLSFILIVQQLGFSIREIKAALKGLPEGRTPTQKDWTALSRRMRDTLDERIGKLTRLREQLDGCIGCGCLSLRRCALYNPQDRVRARGPGPVTLLTGPNDES